MEQNRGDDDAAAYDERASHEQKTPDTWLLFAAPGGHDLIPGLRADFLLEKRPLSPAL